MAPKVAGNIHRSTYRVFWTDHIKPDQWVLQVLDQGCKLPFQDGEPQAAYREKNNKSAFDNMPFVKQEVDKYKCRGVVQRVQKAPLCVSPLTVAARELAEGEIKNRLCLDLSRWINLLLKKEAVSLPGLEKALKCLMPGDSMSTYNLSSAYHHVKIFEGHRKFLGFSIPGEQGEEFYVFTCMPFGLASATHCLARMTKPICAFLAKEGIRNTIYIDDGWIPALLKLLAQQYLARTLQVLEAAGFIVATEKTDKPEDASQRKEYLGFIIDSTSMTVSAPDSKIQECRSLLIETVREHETKAKRLAKVIGKAISLQIATGPVVQLLTRAAQAELAETVEASLWGVTVRLSQDTRESLELLASVLPEFNGHPIRNESTAVPLERFIESSKDTEGRQIFGIDPAAPSAVIASDSSYVAACAYDVRDAGRIFVQEFSLEQAQLSSDHRELLDVLAALKSGASKLKHEEQKVKSIFWLTDSANLVVSLTKGSTKKASQKDVFEVFKITRDLKLDIIPIHLHREDYRIQVADHGSRFFDPDDWSIDNESFELITRQFTPTVDLFAHFSNAKCKKFYSFAKLLTPRV